MVAQGIVFNIIGDKDLTLAEVRGGGRGAEIN